MRAMARRLLSVSVVRNMAFVAVTQIGNYALPLIAIPYLTRTLGPEHFGLISFAQVLTGYLTIFINYGFEMTATREISIHHDSPAVVSAIFSHVLFIKSLLFILATAVLGGLLLVNRFRADSLLYLTTHMVNIGMVLFPMWLFQGLEKAKLAAVLNFCVKLLFTAGTFIIIKQPADYLRSNFLLSASQVLVGIISLFIAIRFLKVSFTKISWQYAWKLFKDGFWVFCSTAIVLTYTTANIFLLGLYASKSEVGYFNVAYKIIFAVHAIVVVPVNLAFFPFITKRFHAEPKKARLQFNKAVYFLLAATLVIALGLFIFARPIVLIFGKEYIATEPILKTLSIGMNCWLIPRYGTYSVAWAWVITESVIFTSCSLIFRYKVRKRGWAIGE